MRTHLASSPLFEILTTVERLVPERHCHLSATRQVAAQSADDLRHLVEPHRFHSERSHDLRRLGYTAQVDLVCKLGNGEEK